MQQPKRKRRLVMHIKTVLGKLSKDLEIGPSDLGYVLRRLHSEGLPFVTKILPLFSKFAIRCCEEQRVLPRSSLTNFEWSGRAPRFMRGLLLEAISGNPVALRCIRQFCDYFYKVAFDFTRNQLESAERTYVSVDLSLETSQNGNVYEQKAFWEAMRKNLHALFPLASTISADSIFRQVRPHDGPGSFAGSVRAKTDYCAAPELTKKYPGVIIGTFDRGGEAFSGYFRSLPGAAREPISSRDSRIRLKYPAYSTRFTSELAFVPKDARGPRVISKEPYHRMKAQLSFDKVIKSLLTAESRHRINFADQSVNQKLARESSIDRSFATMDLKDASDRVSLALVGHLLQHTSGLRKFVNTFRSTHVKLPIKGVHRLRKFANMGSGMCFPILALVVYLAAVTNITETYHLPLSQARDVVYVYGDDLIVPTRLREIAERGLEKAGLMLNKDKSFSKGYFRESCGADYYHGVDVGIVRLKLSGEPLGTVANYRNGFVPLESDRGYLQLERHCRELVDAGLFSTARYHYKSLQKVLKLPSVARESSVLGVYDPLGLVGVKADEPDEGKVPMSYRKSSVFVCQTKLLAESLKGGIQGTDPNLIPLRYKIVLKKKRDMELVSRYPYGLTGNPNEVLNLGSLRRSFTS